MASRLIGGSWFGCLIGYLWTPVFPAPSLQADDDKGAKHIGDTVSLIAVTEPKEIGDDTYQEAGPTSVA